MARNTIEHYAGTTTMRIGFSGTVDGMTDQQNDPATETDFDPGASGVSA